MMRLLACLCSDFAQKESSRDPSDEGDYLDYEQDSPAAAAAAPPTPRGRVGGRGGRGRCRGRGRGRGRDARVGRGAESAGAGDGDDSASRTRIHWGPYEDVHLVQCFLQICTDPAVGVNQTNEHMWKRILKAFYANTSTPATEWRKFTSLKSRQFTLCSSIVSQAPEDQVANSRLGGCK